MFMGSSDVNYIEVTASQDPDDQEERERIPSRFTHSLQSAATKNTPPWFGEGMAEYFSTFRMDGKDERQAVIGRVIGDHVELLREQCRPLGTMLAVTHASPMYNDDGKRRNVFYAEAWATVHYILAEVPNAAVAIYRDLTAVERRRCRRLLRSGVRAARRVRQAGAGIRPPRGIPVLSVQPAGGGAGPGGVKSTDARFERGTRPPGRASGAGPDACPKARRASMPR